VGIESQGRVEQGRSAPEAVDPAQAVATCALLKAVKRARRTTREPEPRGVSRTSETVVRYGRAEASRPGIARRASRDPARDALPLPRLGHAGPAARAVPARRRAQRAHLGPGLRRAQDRAALPGARSARPR